MGFSHPRVARLLTLGYSMQPFQGIQGPPGNQSQPFPLARDRHLPIAADGNQSGGVGNGFGVQEQGPEHFRGLAHVEAGDIADILAKPARSSRVIHGCGHARDRSADPVPLHRSMNRLTARLPTLRPPWIRSRAVSFGGAWHTKIKEKLSQLELSMVEESSARSSSMAPAGESKT